MSGPCIQGLKTQISSGQAGAEINRDLETLFAGLNQVILCVKAISDVLEKATGGAFQGGTPGTGATLPGGPGPGGTEVVIVERGSEGSFLVTSSGSNITLPDGNIQAYIEPTASIDVTLGNPGLGDVGLVQHTGASNTITFKDNLGNTIATINTQQLAIVRTYLDTSGAPTWQTGALVFGKTGIVYTDDDVVFRNNAVGPVVKDVGDGEFVRLLTNAGVMANVDTASSTEPS